MTKGLSLLAASTAALLSLTGAANAVPAIGIVGGNALFSFDTATPGANSAPLSISGLQGGDTLLGIDYRPANSVLYGLGSSGTLYTINTGNGAAMLASTLSTGLMGNSFDISFNPAVDRLRIVGVSGQDLRVNVDTGAVTVDGVLAYAAGDPNAGRAPGVTGAGYTNQVGGTVASTTLYDIDPSNGVLVTQNPPNNGTLNTVGALGVSGLQSFDIDGNTGLAYAASASSFYRVNLMTGAASLVGGFGASNVTDFALVQTPVQTPEPMSLVLLGTGMAGLAYARRRRVAQPA